MSSASRMQNLPSCDFAQAIIASAFTNTETPSSFSPLNTGVKHTGNSRVSGPSGFWLIAQTGIQVPRVSCLQLAIIHTFMAFLDPLHKDSRKIGHRPPRPPAAHRTGG